MGSCTSNDASPQADKRDRPEARPASPRVVPHEMVQVSPEVMRAAKEAADTELKAEKSERKLSNASRRTSANGQEFKTLRIGDEAPNFECDSTMGRLNWHKYIEGSWAMLMSHPRDFTPVCTTEIGMAAHLSGNFAKLGCKLAVVSVDDVESHKKWVEEMDQMNKKAINFPLLGDETKKIAMLYGMLDQTHLDDQGIPLTVRSVFIIGPDKKIKLILAYPASCGRNFFEILRCVESLQLTMNARCATPANWTPGDKVCLLPSVSDEDAAKYSSLQVTNSRCKLRMVDPPAQ